MEYLYLWHCVNLTTMQFYLLLHYQLNFSHVLADCILVLQ